MPAAKQHTALTGPHQCASMGNSLVKHIFGTLYEQAKRRDGHLSIEHLQHIEKAFDSTQGPMSQIYTDTYNFCMEATGKKNLRKFDPDKLFPFYIGHFCKIILLEACPVQAGVGQEKWLRVVSKSIAKYIRSKVSIPVDNILNVLYFAVSDQKGRGLTAFDLMSDERIRQTVEEVLVSFHRIRRDDAGMLLELAKQINNQIKIDFQGLRITRLSVTAEQVHSILMALEEPPFETLVSLEKADL